MFLEGKISNEIFSSKILIFWNFFKKFFDAENFQMEIFSPGCFYKKRVALEKFSISRNFTKTFLAVRIFFKDFIAMGIA